MLEIKSPVEIKSMVEIKSPVEIKSTVEIKINNESSGLENCLKQSTWVQIPPSPPF
ncbi:13233_t:CDS:2 [Gigaspora margarita]|uniref:13233_t:CDS:1 n=1 Tax=Gigaspora margarita TaxID=4874 RepID=A0ABM8VYC9_GIGMA|nr:13233_t:CDS:2 [Gigaspora margarita]